MFVSYYVICVIYCFYQLFKNLDKRYSNDPTGGSPELDAIMILVMAWVLAPVDVSLTWIRWYKDAEEARRRSISTNFLDADTFRNEETHIY